MVRGVGLKDPKLEKYLFPGISGCIFAPGTGGPGESSCPEDSEYVWQMGVGGVCGRVTAGRSRPWFHNFS